MPLSREEQRVLAEIERALLLEDRSFADRDQGRRRRPRVLFVATALGFACGVTLITIGLVGTDRAHIAVAVIGFVVLVACCFALADDLRRRSRRRPRRR